MTTSENNAPPTAVNGRHGLAALPAHHDSSVASKPIASPTAPSDPSTPVSFRKEFIGGDDSLVDAVMVFGHNQDALAPINDCGYQQIDGSTLVWEQCHDRLSRRRQLLDTEKQSSKRKAVEVAYDEGVWERQGSGFRRRSPAVPTGALTMIDCPPRRRRRSLRGTNSEDPRIGIGPQHQAVLPARSDHYHAPKEYIGEVIWDPERAAAEGDGKLEELLLKDAELRIRMKLLEAAHQSGYKGEDAVRKFTPLDQLAGEQSVEWDENEQKIFDELIMEQPGLSKKWGTIAAVMGRSQETVLVHYYRWKGGQKNLAELHKRQRHQEPDYCDVCDDGGTLIVCEICRKAFHLGCLRPPLLHVPAEQWYCEHCMRSNPARVRRLSIGSPPKMDTSPTPRNSSAKQNLTDSARRQALKTAHKELFPRERNGTALIRGPLAAQRRADGTFVVPRGRRPAGMRWDGKHGVWVRILPQSASSKGSAISATSLVDDSVDVDSGLESSLDQDDSSDDDSDKKPASKARTKDKRPRELKLSSSSEEPDSEFEEAEQASTGNDEDDYEPERSSATRVASASILNAARAQSNPKRSNTVLVESSRPADVGPAAPLSQYQSHASNMPVQRYQMGGNPAPQPDVGYYAAQPGPVHMGVLQNNLAMMHSHGQPTLFPGAPMPQVAQGQRQVRLQPPVPPAQALPTAPAAVPLAMQGQGDASGPAPPAAPEAPVAPNQPDYVVEWPVTKDGLLIKIGNVDGRATFMGYLLTKEGRIGPAQQANLLRAQNDHIVQVGSVHCADFEFRDVVKLIKKRISSGDKSIMLGFKHTSLNTNASTNGNGQSSG